MLYLSIFVSFVKQCVENIFIYVIIIINMTFNYLNTNYFFSLLYFPIIVDKLFCFFCEVAMVRIAVCDDNNQIRSKLINMINLIMEQNNIRGEVIFDSDNADDFFKFVFQNHVDVVILDIELKAMQSGIDLAKKIRDANKSINIIFCTAHIEYVLLGYKFKTFDYLVKPVSYEKLEECILRLVKYISTDSVDSLKIKSGSTTYVVMKNDIIFIEKAKSKTHLYTSSEMIETNMNLEEFEKSLPSNFVRAHKSYIVNTNKIVKVDYVLNEIDMINSYKCYLGRKFKKQFCDIFINK